jgi:phosphoribosylformylglycinamidine (FGAM) synthase-like enzyme
MNNDKNRLSELDIKDITSKLGRNPTAIELSFIELILSNELKTKDYLRILSRLDDGAKREANNKIEFDDKSNLFVNTGFKILNQDQSFLINRDETKYINKINGLSTVLDNIVINSPNNSDVEKIIKKELVNRKGSNAIGGRFIKEENGIIFSLSIGIKDKININEKLQINNSLVYKINFGKRYFQKNITQLIKIINALTNETWFLFAKSINWNGLGVAIINLIKETAYGISIIKDISSESINSHFSDDNTLSILIVIQQGNLPQLSLFCKKNDLSKNEIGILINEPVILLNNKNDTLINLPATVFDLQFNVNVQHFIQPKIGIESYKYVLKIYKSGSFTNQLLKLFTNTIKEDVLLLYSAKNRKLTNNYSSYGLYSINNSMDDQIVLTTADKNYLRKISPRLSGRISVANAGRRLACTGKKPIAMIIQNIFPKINKDSSWTASELLQGQEEAIREMEVEIGSRTIDTFENHWHQNISAIGIHHQDSVKMDISFKQAGDFISLLGSHRGELGGSAYERYISAKGSGVLPNVDLRMENRLQDVVRQGINTNLIKSAVNVSTGGISIAIAKSIIASADGIGARIHLSRKLKNEELLFGETQGMVVVSLSENDIMEFERICMTIGVPSTTIGRVTDNNLFTFNDVIKTKVDRLRSIVN